MREAVARKYFGREEWETEYDLITGEQRRMARYAGCGLLELERLPLSLYLTIKRDSWIESMQQSEESRRVLKELWRLQQTRPDLKKIREREVKERESIKRSPAGVRSD